MTTLHVLSAGATQGLVEELRPSFEAATGHAIKAVFGAVGAMKARLLAGEPADLVILSRALIDGLAKDGHVIADSVTDLGSAATAIAMRQGDPPPPIIDKTSLRDALLAAGAIHLPDPQQATAGIHFTRVVRDLGIWDDVTSRMRTAPNGATAMRALAASTKPRAIGCTQATEIVVTPGIVLVTPLPRGYDLATTYTAAIPANARDVATARQLVTMLTDTARSDARRRLGFA